MSWASWTIWISTPAGWAGVSRRLACGKLWSCWPPCSKADATCETRSTRWKATSGKCRPVRLARCSARLFDVFASQLRIRSPPSRLRAFRGTLRPGRSPTHGQTGLPAARLDRATAGEDVRSYPPDGPMRCLRSSGYVTCSARITPVRFNSLAATSHTDGTGASMGDKGGKKDKEKAKQQQVKKQKQEVQRKQDKAPPRTP